MAAFSLSSPKIQVSTLWVGEVSPISPASLIYQRWLRLEGEALDGTCSTGNWLISSVEIVID